MIRHVPIDYNTLHDPETGEQIGGYPEYGWFDDGEPEPSGETLFLTAYSGAPGVVYLNGDPHQHGQLEDDLEDGLNEAYGAFSVLTTAKTAYPMASSKTRGIPNPQGDHWRRQAMRRVG